MNMKKNHYWNIGGKPPRTKDLLFGLRGGFDISQYLPEGIYSEPVAEGPPINQGQIVDNGFNLSRFIPESGYSREAMLVSFMAGMMFITFLRK